MAIKFKELKGYLSRVNRLSICFENGHYDNYVLVSDIPEGKYDELYVYGVGMVDVEFPLDVYSEPIELPEMISKNLGFIIGSALEIVVSEEPRDIIRLKNDELTFGDLREYLQMGRFFSIVRKEGWNEEVFEYRQEIPEEYNNMYVYGIGMEDNLIEMHRIVLAGITDSCLAKRLRIVVSERPKGKMLKYIK